MRVVIVGSGNMASVLGVALRRVGVPPVQIFARNLSEGRRVAEQCGCTHSSEPADLKPAELYIIALSDRAIEEVASTLDFGSAVVSHTAGSVAMDVLSPIKNRAVLYPLQTFTKGRDVDFTEVPIFIEGATPKAVECMREVAGSLSQSVLEMDSSHRVLVHMAAVFVSNFTNYMYTIGAELMKEAGADFATLKPLILETALKAIAANSPQSVQTGPAVRNDLLTQALHTELLDDRVEMREIYEKLSKLIWETSKKI